MPHSHAMHNQAMQAVCAHSALISAKPPLSFTTGPLMPVNPLHMSPRLPQCTITAAISLLIGYRHGHQLCLQTLHAWTKTVGKNWKNACQNTCTTSSTTNYQTPLKSDLNTLGHTNTKVHALCMIVRPQEFPLLIIFIRRVIAMNTIKCNNGLRYLRTDATWSRVCYYLPYMQMCLVRNVLTVLGGGVNRPSAVSHVWLVTLGAGLLLFIMLSPPSSNSLRTRWNWERVTLPMWTLSQSSKSGIIWILLTRTCGGDRRKRRGTRGRGLTKHVTCASSCTFGMWHTSQATK